MKRREFISKTSMGTAGALLASAGLGLASSCKGANDRIIIALIGCGARGRATIINMCKVNDNVIIKYGCDVNDIKAEMFAQQVDKELNYKIELTRDMKKVLDDKEVDAVMVATPEHWHALATIWACQAGKDVIVEKCPTISIWEGQKLKETVAKYKRIVQVCTQNRSAAYAFSARDYIKEGKLGKIVHVKTYNMLGGNPYEKKPDTAVPEGLDWDAWIGPAPYRPYNPGVHAMNSRGGWGDYWDFSGGVLSDDGSHILDLARLVLGDPESPRSVYSWGGNHIWGSDRESPEVQSVIFDFDKFTLTMDTGNVTNYMKKTSEKIRFDTTLFPDWNTNATRIEIYGTEGMMYVGRHGGGWQVIGPDSQIVAQQGGMHPDNEHLVNFIDCVRTRKNPNGNIIQGHLSASLVHLANISYRVGKQQLLFDGKNERFTNSEEANKFLKTMYRDKYAIPDKV